MVKLTTTHRDGEGCHDQLPGHLVPDDEGVVPVSERRSWRSCCPHVGYAARLTGVPASEKNGWVRCKSRALESGTRHDRDDRWYSTRAESLDVGRCAVRTIRLRLSAPRRPGRRRIGHIELAGRHWWLSTLEAQALRTRLGHRPRAPPLVHRAPPLLAASSKRPYTRHIGHSEPCRSAQAALHIGTHRPFSRRSASAAFATVVNAGPNLDIYRRPKSGHF